jgi:hypothetical protein
LRSIVKDGGGLDQGVPSVTVTRSPAATRDVVSRATPTAVHRSPLSHRRTRSGPADSPLVIEAQHLPSRSEAAPAAHIPSQSPPPTIETQSDTSQESTVVLVRLGRRLQHIVDLTENVPSAPSSNPAATACPPIPVEASLGSVDVDMFPLDADKSCALSSSASVLDAATTAPASDSQFGALGMVAAQNPPTLPVHRQATPSRSLSDAAVRFSRQQSRFAKLKTPQAPSLPPSAVVMPRVNLDKMAPF